MQSLDISTFLKARPTAAIPGIGRKSEIKTKAHGWLTAWDFTAADKEEVSRTFGKNGREMQRELNGECVSVVSSERAAPKSVSRCRSFRPTRDRSLLWAHLLKHLEYIVMKMRRDGLSCRGISVWLRSGAERG